MSRLRRLAAAATVVATNLLSPPCRSDAGSSDQANRDAATHFDRGVRLSESDDWNAAGAEFERAYALSPNYRVLYDIGECRYRLKDYAGAILALERFLAEGDSRVPPFRRAAVEGAILKLRMRVAQVRVTSNPSGAEIRVDGKVVGTTPLSRPLVLNAGLRKISAAKSGYVSASQYLDIAEQGSLDVAFGLSSSRPALDPRGVRRQQLLQAKLPVGGTTSVLPAIAFFGLAASGLGVGVAFGVDAAAAKHKLERECVNGTCPASSQALIDDSRRSAVLSTVGFAVGLAGAGAGVAFLLLHPSAGRTVGGPGIRPSVGIGSIGAIGTF